MADSFLGEIRILPYTFSPYQWAFCNGQAMPVSQYTALFAVIGTLYGGDGQTTFKLPNLQGQIPMGTGTGPGLTARTIAQQTGAESVTLTAAQMATHTHTVTAKSVANAYLSENMLGTPASDSWLSRAVQTTTSGLNLLYSYTASGSPDVTLAGATFGSTGGAPTQAHENRQPYLPMQFCISLNGEFPVKP